MRIDPISELGGLRALARSLVQGDADADDLLQDAAVAMLEHPPKLDRPVRPWLATVIVNRWRMNRRGASRRRAREAAIEVPEAEHIDPHERAQMLRRLGDAVAALREPYRELVIARYFDGKTSIELARELGIPPVTVRTRLVRALDMLRAALDESAPRKRWQQLLVPQAGWFVQAKAHGTLLMLLFLLLASGAWLVWPRGHAAPASASTPAGAVVRAMTRAVVPPPRIDTPPAGQRRAVVESGATLAAGRVIDASSGDGVADAELMFDTDGGSTSLKTGADGSFELAAEPGVYTLAQISAAGYLPYAPESPASAIRFELVRDRAVRGLTVMVVPALDYHGRVVDGDGKPVAGATISVVGTAPDARPIETAWTSDRDGRFSFHAAAHAVLEASSADRLGWGSVDPDVEITKQLQIVVARVPAHDATIAGRVVDEAGKPLADVVVRAAPEHDKMEKWSTHRSEPPRASAFALSAADGAFEVHGLDRGAYLLSAELDDRAPVMTKAVASGAKNVTIEMPPGLGLAGTVASADGAPVPAFTLLVLRRVGAARELVLSRSVVDARGHFAVRVAAGAYELVASAPGWAPTAPQPAQAPGGESRLVVSAGATLRGKVVSAIDGAPIAHARVVREALGGESSAQPVSAGTATRGDGTFELRGLPPGPACVAVTAPSFDEKIESGIVAVDGGELGPVSIALSPVAPGGTPKTEYVGVGITTSTDGDDLLVDSVVAGGGADVAGMLVGDRIVAVDGAVVAEVGDVGTVARIRGMPNTTVTFVIRRGERLFTLAATRSQLQT